MKDLVKWQVISFVSRFIAMALGIVQSVFIAHILSVSEYGVIGIVSSIGAVFGVYQHLGLASGSTREISAAKDKQEVFKIFFTSIFIRYLVTIPLAIGLFIISKYLSITKYSNPALVIPLRLYSLVLFIQGVQSIFNSVISGTHRFKLLFTYQALISIISLVLYLPLIYLYKVNGYFIALVLFNLIGSLSLGYLALRPYFDVIALPTKAEFRHLLKEILSISLGIYLVKILHTMWQRSGPILLGTTVPMEQVGYFSFALLYSGKLMAVSDSVTDVNLPVLSKEYSESIENFKDLFLKNFNKIYAFIIFCAVSAVFWSYELISLLGLNYKYGASLPLIYPLVFAFVFYSLLDIVKSSIAIPSKMVKGMVATFVLMLLATVGSYHILASYFMGTIAMAYAMVCGALFGFLVIVLISQIKLKFVFFNFFHILLLFLGVSLCQLLKVGLYYKFVVYMMFLLAFLLLSFIGKIIVRAELVYLFSRVKRK